MRISNRRLAVALALCLICAPQTQAEQQPDGPLLRAPDHVLLWSQQAGSAERILAGLGFVVRAGQTYPEGITSGTVTFSDWSYIELLHYADPSKASDNAQAKAELAFVADGPGANSFAVEVRDVEAAAAHLKRQGFFVADIVPDMVDPDGPEGPQPPKEASWRDFHFAASPVSGVDLFFIQNPLDPPPSPEAKERFRVRTTHDNTARRLSSVWILVPDLDAEADVYRRMGFAVGPALDVPHLNGRAQVATLGGGAVILTQSSNLPNEFHPLKRNGPRVIGLGFEVPHLAAAETMLKRQSGVTVQKTEGPMGRSLLAQTTATLGLFLEFREAK
jgi:hypothetical protein